MSRTMAVIRREFTEMVRTKAFVIGTVLGPALMIGIIGLQVLMARGSGGERTIAIVDASANGIGEAVSTALGPQLVDAVIEGRSRFRTEVIPLDGVDPDSLRSALQARVSAKEIDGYLWLPRGVVHGEVATYEGRNAASFGDMERVRSAMQRAVQQVRLAQAGIDAEKVAAALAPVPFEARKTGDKAASGTPFAMFMLAYILGFATYMIVILYGNAILRGVLEEKRDRIVEVVASSIRTHQLMMGKVVGIGAAGVFQILIWASFAALITTKGNTLATNLGATLPEMPSVPVSVGVVFLIFFVAGFLLYSAMYAAMGAIATTDQEAQQLQYPVIMFLVVAIMMMMPVIDDPTGPVATIGSIVPFTSPVVMPMRAALSEVPLIELLGSIVLVAVTAFAVMWLAARIYRIGILATGKRPSFREVLRWLRTA